jgi:hypothetical protein
LEWKRLVSFTATWYNLWPLGIIFGLSV